MSEQPTPQRVRVLTQQCFDAKEYEYDFSFKSNNPDNFWGAHTTVEMLQCLERNKKIELDARILGASHKENRFKYKRYDHTNFREAYVEADKLLANTRFREGGDGFLTADGIPGSSGSNLIGRDFTPLLGGPFYKNLYFYEDYIRMHAESFFAYHNDPLAKAITSITRDFVIGRGYEIQTDTDDPKGKIAMATWKAFEKVNNLKSQIDYACIELSIYGETMGWKLPKNQTKIVYRPGPDDPIPVGIIPRIRFIDPSNIVEIITMPEDITRRLLYVWLAPTQYQIYTSGLASQQTEGTPIQPTLKYIYQQIPADQMLHYKVNTVSNEKRGRSDYFPVLGYMKRLRDSVEYSMLALQKVSAWSMDTSIDGDQTDIDNYVASQIALGTIPDAASEFVHSTKVKREYLGNSHTQGSVSDAFLWNFSLVCAGVQIPSNYFGTHLSGGQTRAGAVVATEPVAKKMEARRLVVNEMLTDLWEWVMKEAGLGDVPCQVIFPEIITQDRSAKLKDLQLANQENWMSHERCAGMAAKEFGVNDYNYQQEQEDIKQDQPDMPAPLTQPGQTSQPFGGMSGPSTSKGADQDEESSGMSLTSDERRGVKINGANF